MSGVEKCMIWRDEEEFETGLRRHEKLPLVCWLCEWVAA